MRASSSINFPESLVLADKSYQKVDVQRGGLSAIYSDTETFLRIGAPEKVSKDLAVHKHMEGLGYPVAKILGEGNLDSLDYFIETSLGPKHFGLIFKDETEQFGKITDKTFDSFVELCLKFAGAQIKSVLPDKNWPEFDKGIHLDTICEELPGEAERILAKYNKVKSRLSAFPFALCHGDFGPFNLYPKGMIDLESSFVGPVGYDVGAVVRHCDWFPESRDYEFYQLYNFNPEQKGLLTSKLDALYVQHSLPKLSEYLDDFNFLRGIWFAVKLGHTPKLREFRYSLLRSKLDR
jgi:hypothetical protein